MSNDEEFNFVGYWNGDKKNPEIKSGLREATALDIPVIITIKKLPNLKRDLKNDIIKDLPNRSKKIKKELRNLLQITRRLK